MSDQKRYDGAKIEALERWLNDYQRRLGALEEQVNDQSFVPDAPTTTVAGGPVLIVPEILTISITREQLPSLNDCLYFGVAHSEVEDRRTILAFCADVQEQLQSQGIRL